MAATSTETADAVKAALLGHCLELADVWAAKVLESDNPKDYKDFIETTLKSNGAFSKEDAGAHLPTFHITIGSNGQITAAPTQMVEVVENAPAELAAPSVDPEYQRQIEESLSIFDLDFSPVE